MRLTILSHTPHYRTPGGEVTGWGPTVREINHLAGIFSEIIHLAPLHHGNPPGSSLPYHPNITFVALRPSGGTSLLDKAGILSAALHNIVIIRKHYRNTGWFHLRAPANLMLYALPLLKLSRVRQAWIKYAGSWRDDNVPLTYRWQRAWLKRFFHAYKVTVNGRLPDDPPHILSFENPCLDVSEFEDARIAFQKKDYGDRITICFVGQLEPGKGIIQLLEALLPLDKASKINTLHIVGDGSLLNQVKDMAKSFSSIRIQLHGYLPRQAINEIYAQSHLNILPSESEGFPKVIAEGAAYGAIPVVTDMSSLSEYVNDINGRLLPNNSKDQIRITVQELLQLNREQLWSIASNAVEMARLFTYERYLERIRKDIIGTEKQAV